MRKIVFALLIISNLMLSQNRFEGIKNISDAQNFIDSNPDVKAKIFTKYISKESMGHCLDTISNKSMIVESYKVPFYRVSYIFLDGKILTDKEIEKKQFEIIEKYKEGTDFKELNQFYTMDGNTSKGGDLGWFTENMMVKDFENGIKDRKKDEIFKLNIPDLNWYYVVLKTHDNKDMIELRIITIED